MSDRSIELYGALSTALRGSAALTATLGGTLKVYTRKAPPNIDPPYVVIGDETARDYGASDGDGQEHTVTLHVWAIDIGPDTALKKALQIMRDVRAVLHDADLSLSGGALVNLRQEFKETFADPDGVSEHGVQRYRAVTTG